MPKPPSPWIDPTGRIVRGPETTGSTAHFRLDVWLRRHDKPAEAAQHLAEASRLHPESWNMWRRTADLDAAGSASGEAFWQRVEALGGRPYDQPPDLPGFADQQYA